MGIKFTNCKSICLNYVLAIIILVILFYNFISYTILLLFINKIIKETII